MPFKEAIEEFRAGNGTVGVTSQQLGNPHAVTMFVAVKADVGNSNDIFVGDSGVSATNGFRLDAGEVTPSIPIDDVGKVFVIGGAASQGYSWIAV